MKTSTTKKIKKLFEQGRKVTVVQLDKMFSINNSPEAVRRLRYDHGMNIKTEWHYNPNTKKRYGVYKLAE